ncbi:MAG: phosphate ABC transporter substrate-binding protein PstS, partial [Acidobacteriaceae bacterium]|nr:phosphate ABC transporter substrate-binding protein PstS [Acidobacteriaceae bacterium]
EYSQLHPNVKINYQPIGSGGGIRQVTEGTIDFGAADVALSDQEMNNGKVKVQPIPTVMGAVVPVYNLPGLNTDLKFSGDVIGDIYLGKITKWNDPRIVAENPGVNLPAKSILPVYRSEGSGTTFIFTDFLSKTNPEWESKVGKNTSVKFPVGVGQKGNEGVSGMVRQVPYSFGYVELIYALQNKIPFGLVRNADGKYLKASIEGVSAAAATKKMPADFRVSITNAPGPNAYPISSFTWLLIPRGGSPEKTQALREFLSWMIEHGQDEASGLSYAPLPKPVQEMVRKTVAQMK